MTNNKGILIKNIYYMLAYAYQELKQGNYVDIEGEHFEHIHDLFAQILSTAISFQLKRGLYRSYVHRMETTTTIKGKVDIRETVKLRTCNNPLLACSYDDFSEDNLYNRIIVTTISVLIRCSDIEKKKKESLKRLLPFFAHIQSVEVKSINWKALRFDRNNRHYKLLMYLCYFVLDGLLMTTEQGQYRIREFSDEHMHHLFEKFVLEYYKKHHPSLNPSSSKIEWNIDEDSNTDILPMMKTDITLSKDKRTLIIDTKYYGRSLQCQFNKKTIHSHNLYQIHTYVTEYDKDHSGLVDGMLLYAKTEESIVPDGHIKLKLGNTIYFKTLDLNKDFEDIKNQLEDYVHFL